MSPLTHILIIDPCASSRRHTQELLQAAFPSATVVTAAGVPGPGAPPCDLVITESRWPGVRGAAVVETLLAQDPERPVIVLTAHGDERLAAEMMRAGAADYVPQADVAERLVEALREGWQRAEARRAAAAEVRACERRYRETEARARELAIIHKVAMATATTMDLDELLQQTTQVVVSELYPDVFGFVLRDEGTDIFRAHPSYHGIPAAGYGIAVPVENSVIGRVIRTATPQVVADVRQTEDYFQIVERTRSEIAVPVQVGDGRVIGVINAESAEYNAFSEDDLRFLRTLAGQVALAIERAQRYTLLREDAAQLAAQVATRTGELRAERDRMLAILESAGEGILFTDCDGKIQYVNPAMEQQTGYAREECLGRDPRLWYREETGQNTFAKMRRAVLGGQRWSGEVFCWRKDLSVFEASVSVSPLYREDGELTGFVAVQADISHLKEVERLKSKFVTNVSHELRTPLTNIKTYASLLERGDRDRRQRYLQVIKWETERLERLIHDLLDLSQLDVSSGLALRAVDLPALVNRLLHIFSARAERKGITLGALLPSALPPVLADEERLQQVLHNLLANALAYTPAGGQVSVECGWEQEGAGGEGPAIWLRVRDSGPGIKDEETDLIFDRFYRGRAAQLSTEPGTGLGLAICQEIVYRHGGRLEVEKVPPSEGASFRLWLAAAGQQAGVYDAA